MGRAPHSPLPPHSPNTGDQSSLRYNQGNGLDSQGQCSSLGLVALFCALSICDPVKILIPSSLKTPLPYAFSTVSKSFCQAFKTLHDPTPLLPSSFPGLHSGLLGIPQIHQLPRAFSHTAPSAWNALLLAPWGILSPPTPV